MKYMKSYDFLGSYLGDCLNTISSRGRKLCCSS